MNQPLNPQQTEALTRFIDGETATPEQSEWLAEKAAVAQLGQLLRAHLPSQFEPPSPDFFTSQVMHAIAVDNPTALPAYRPTLWQRLGIWMAPLATATAVLVVGGVLLKRSFQPQTVVYTPDTKIHATLAFNDAAQATVINLTGMEDVPPTEDIKAYNVASSMASPDAPQQFYAANDPDKLLFVIFPSFSGAPTIHEMH